MNNLDSQYQNLLQNILHNGVKKETRNGKTLSIFGYQIRHKMSEGFPLLTTKKIAMKTMVTELKWFLKGDTNIRYLNENGCKIWNGDAYKAYERTCLWELEDPKYTQDEFIQKIMEDNDFNRVWGELGPIYGSQWREWNYKYDQIENLINELKNNPDSRRLMVNAWNVGELENMTLPPCHYGFQVYTRELSMDERFEQYTKTYKITGNHHKLWEDIEHKIPQRTISLMWNQRSVDTLLGLPFNIASYGLLLMLLAKEVNMIPDELIGNLGDTHLYFNHIKQAKEQLSREPYELPNINIYNVNILNGEFDYELIDYKHHPQIKAPLSN